MENPDWETIYTALVYIIKNYPLTIILYCAICIVSGFLISLLFVLLMKKYKAFSRTQKYYNWLVKLYIPAIFIVNIIFSLQLGVFWGAYQGLKKDSHSISSQIYYSGVGAVFRDQKAKTEFIEGVRSVVSEVSRNNKNVKIRMADIISAYDTKYTIIDQPKNRITSWILEHYGEKINTLVLYGILSSVPNVKATGDLSYQDFDKITKQLAVLDPEDIENSMIEKIRNLFLMILKSEFKTLAEGILIVWGLLMLIPWLEFAVYSFIMKRIIKNKTIE
ncbi:hypothetical protein [uncultured Chryseobacterium sp.]|uniref:hypothetical protein n=1 Tax=uncultured Chryseobacterium sp. TaxID=259322 RepID=UPI0025F66C34|nr:hypothetical protein [uncultured Chryseobacterium sp.]